MKTAFTILFSFFLLTAFAQSRDAVEQDLLRDFKRILHWRDYHSDSQTLGVYDSLLNANEQFEKALLKYTSQNPATIAFDFKELKSKGLTISTSDDGLFRIYSWDTWTGGSMHFQQNVFQYKSGDKVFSKIIHESLDDEDHYSVNWYIQVFTVRTPTQTYYLGLYGRTYSNQDANQGVKVFAINGTALNDTAKLIKTGSGMKNKLGFDYNFFSVVDRKERPIKLITYDSNSKTLKMAVVVDEGKVTNRFIVYKFTGQYFERKA
jgi:hypothetical protein